MPPAGPRPIGTDDDPRAVVDENGKVRRVDGPYAGDASIMPDVPSVAINSTVILMAETVADRVKARSGEGDGPTECQIRGHRRAVAVRERVRAWRHPGPGALRTPR